MMHVLYHRGVREMLERHRMFLSGVHLQCAYSNVVFDAHLEASAKPLTRRILG